MYVRYFADNGEEIGYSNVVQLNVTAKETQAPVVGDIAFPDEIEDGTIVEFKTPEVTSELPIKSEGWQCSFDNETWEDFDPTRALTSEDDLMYVRYFADNGEAVGYSNFVRINIKGVENQNLKIRVVDSTGKEVTDFETNGSKILLDKLPEDDYTVTISDTGFVPRTYQLHVDSENNVLEYKLAKPGDVDLNDKIDISDAVKVINSINGVKSLNDYQQAVADVDSSKRVDIEDAAAIINHINGVKALKEYTA